MVLFSQMLFNSHANHILTITIVALTGIPMSGISVVSYQFVSEVTYPVSEVQAVSLMNTVNKLITFGSIQIIQASVDTQS
jgi:hypothetical protein